MQQQEHIILGSRFILVGFIIIIMLHIKPYLWGCGVCAGMISLETSVVVYLLQGYVASGRQVRQYYRLVWKELHNMQGQQVRLLGGQRCIPSNKPSATATPCP